MIPNERPKKCQIPQIMLNHLSIIEKRSCDFDKIRGILLNMHSYSKWTNQNQF